MTNYRNTERIAGKVRDACDAAAYWAFNEQTDHSASAAHYLAVNAAEYAEQARFYALAGDDHGRALAQVRSDAYADALRVVDLAGDAYDRRARQLVRMVVDSERPPSPFPGTVLAVEPAE